MVLLCHSSFVLCIYLDVASPWCLFAALFSAEIIMLEGLTCVYRSNVDLFFYVVGSAQENEVGSSLMFRHLDNTLQHSLNMANDYVFNNLDHITLCSFFYVTALHMCSVWGD